MQIYTIKKIPIRMILFLKKVLRVGIEPTLSKELDFESSASTNSATEAGGQIYKKIYYFIINTLS